MAKQQFFKKIEDSERKEVAILVRLSKNDANTIHESANIRKLSMADFIRRAALGRKADTRYEGMIILQLSEVINFGCASTARQAQRFLSAHYPIHNLFRIRRFHATASGYREAHQHAFLTWNEASCAHGFNNI